MTQPTPSRDIKGAVALQFAARPTLRQVVEQQAKAMLVQQLPQLSNDRREMLPGASLWLMAPKDGFHHPQGLADALLDAFLQRKVLDFSPVDGLHYYLTLLSPSQLQAKSDAQQNDDDDYIELQALQDACNDLLLMLPDHFRQAQVDFWAATGSVGESRDTWLQQVLKSALLHSLPFQGLGDAQRDAVLALLRGGSAAPSVSCVQAKITVAGQTFALLTPNLLIQAERDEQRFVLWCAPCGTIKHFDEIGQFTAGLREELAWRYSFDSLSWDQYEVQGDVFANQAALMLEAQLEDIGKLRLDGVRDRSALEDSYAAISDPARWFVEGVGQDGTQVPLPPGLQRARAKDSFAYQAGLFELALAQARSRGESALQGVLDLRSYSRERLREQLLDDYPDEANYFSDDLILTLSHSYGVPGGAGTGTGDGVVQQRSMSLTEFAIGNVSSLKGAVITAITHRNDQLIMDWMNADYIRSLVTAVDIGGNYPRYVADKLDERSGRAVRVERFAHEWRCSFLHSALAARLGNSLSESGLACVVKFCRAPVVPAPLELVLMPLVFRRRQDETTLDRVLGMYVLYCVGASNVILYRPLYGGAAITEFTSTTAMMEAIRADGALQDSVLEWLDPDASVLYARGGFLHMSGAILDTSLLPEQVPAPTFAAQYWQVDVDQKLYTANRDLLVALADRQSVSNTESRWALLLEGAWLLFETTSLLLRGPVASVAWLVQGVLGLKQDVQALQHGNAFERSAAVVDIVLNTAMALMHAQMPKVALPVPGIRPEAVSLPGALEAEPLLVRSPVVAASAAVKLPAELDTRFDPQLDFSWRGRQGLNALTQAQQQALLAMRSSISLNTLKPQEQGPEQGLYAVAGKRYATLLGDAYRVEVLADGVRVVDGQGEMGPWLAFEHGAWRIDSRLRLLGGMRSRMQKLRLANAQRITELKDQEAVIAQAGNALMDTFVQRRTAYTHKTHDRLALEQSQASGSADELALARKAEKGYRQLVIKDMRAVLDNQLEHDRVLGELAAMRLTEAGFADLVAAQRGMTREAYFDMCESYYNEMAAQINEESVGLKGAGVDKLPQGKDETDAYQAFRKTLETVTDWELELNSASADFDRLLEDTSKNETLSLGGGAGSRASRLNRIKAILEQRKNSAVDLEFRTLKDLAELSLDRLADTTEAELDSFQEHLMGADMLSAGAAHGALAGSDFSLAEQISVLEGVLDAYEEAAGMAAYLEKMGGAAIHNARLKQYRELLQKLTDGARRELAAAVKEQDLSEVRAPRLWSYPARGGKRRVVNTQRGRSVVGDETQVDGESLVQQKDIFTNEVIKTFHKQDDVWVEKVESAPPETVAPAIFNLKKVQQRARALLGKVDEVTQLASAYWRSEEVIGLKSVLEEHASRLNEVKGELDGLGAQAKLVRELQAAVARLQNHQYELLRSLYFTTQRPTAAGLRFLVDAEEVDIAQVTRRKYLKSYKDYLDVHEIRRKPRPGKAKGELLWEAHLHYAGKATPARAFTKAHLKMPDRDAVTYQMQLRGAASGREVVEIYRGNLTLRDMDGILELA